MGVLIPWERLLEQSVQLFYSLSDPATEDMLYKIERVRRLTGISQKKVPERRQF